MRTCDTVAKHPIPPLILCCCITVLYVLYSSQHIHRGPHLQLLYQKNSSGHAHGEMIRGGNLKHFKTSVG